ncbi:sensor histidine kinase [Paenibacillus sp. BC26]|uniref:sensor histidine kinase n=1 Tax=Paenibacillus sp. BC26 TaxID=1881032 RepID=UPI0008E7C5DD|nr:sensor histidine kinase [Paenibacillus sp. BC26]SFT20421.1 two-component system, NarL family, sensor histidine kinase DesK [Paenibacillus sp. BC26]
MPKMMRRPPVGPPVLFAMIWLVYLVFPLYHLFNQTPARAAMGLTAVVVFIAIYIYSYCYERGRLLCILGMLLIIGVFCFSDEASLYMAFYPAPIIGMLTSRKQLTIAFGGLVALFASTMWYWKLYDDTDALLQFLPAMIVIIVIPFALVFGRRSRELRQKLILANEEISRLSKNEERQRISRDLHDTLGHTLSLITLKSELAEKLILKQPERAVQEVRDIQATSRAALRQVRELVSGMNAVKLRDEVDQAKKILAAAGIVLERKGSDFDRELPSPLLDNILGMCLRESVTNIVKHSRARVCTVRLEGEPGKLKLIVADDGIGVSKSSEAAESRPFETGGGLAGGNGLRGMRERLKLIDGDLALESVGRGTMLTFTVPLVEKSPAKEGGR